VPNTEKTWRPLVLPFVQVVANLKLSDSEFGLLTGVIFVFFYSIMGLLFQQFRIYRPPE